MELGFSREVPYTLISSHVCACHLSMLLCGVPPLPSPNALVWFPRKPSVPRLSDTGKVSSMLRLKRGGTGTSYRAIDLRTAKVEPGPLKYPNSFLVRSPAKSFVVQASSSVLAKVWESGESLPQAAWL